MISERFPVAWITGASSGIGRALALRLARDGCTVAASARRADALAELASEAGGLTGRILPFRLDVTDADAMRRVWDDIVARTGVPDLCVFNAGAYRPVDARKIEAAPFRDTFDVNVIGTVQALEFAVPPMVARGAGRIAIVASVAGYRGLPSAAAYGSSKAAAIHLAETLHLELKPAGIHVQVVNPGFVATPMTERNDFPMPFLMPVDRAVDRLVAGLASDRFEITFPKRFTWMLKLLRLLPYAIYLPLVGRATRRNVPDRSA